MSLVGFLAPDGTWSECECFGHMSFAKIIAKARYDKVFDSGYDAERFLYENGYVGLYARNAGHTWLSEVDKRIITLTDEQRDFIITHLEDANNDDQKKSMLEMLEWDDAYREESILHHYETGIGE